MAPSFVRAISLIFVLALSSIAYKLSDTGVGRASLLQECPIFFTTTKKCDPIAPKSFLPANVMNIAKNKDEDKDGGSHSPNLNVLADVLESMEVMQTEYFAPWLGTWPDAIDWTAAVMGTHVSGAVRSLSEALAHLNSKWEKFVDWKLQTNLVDKYFTQITAYYFGQDAFAIRNEAYDDILWVVLGWLEAIQLVNVHTDLHFRSDFQDEVSIPEANSFPRLADFFLNQTYHGNVWIPAFAHRARVFWELASVGWDTKLCGGGMVWNPRLLPYKNAITNELFIAASISMYLNFPGDDNPSPFYGSRDTSGTAPHTRSGPRDARYLKAAVEGYKWLVSSNMTDEQGLYTDGFHISGYQDTGNNNTKCDERNEMVLSYNQGVLLTGLRGLWDATGASSYLSDGHKLIQNVIRASGYNLASDSPIEDLLTLKPGHLPKWHGLGRAGVMEDPCDASGTCSQDGQTFKGIFFHHLTSFCAPLVEPFPTPDPEIKVDARAFTAARDSHAGACAAYGGWLKHNARAALATRKDGKFGQWWTAGLLDHWVGPWPTMEDDGIPRASNKVDYRNYGVPNDTTWRAQPGFMMPSVNPDQAQKPLFVIDDDRRIGELKKRQEIQVNEAGGNATDPNTRGRGRTVETQGGGLALMRAYWQIVHAP
ncbi:glycoside hydrolase family 76 protein [Annulohypoxylon maeteangense]|uniref:glycoside hydrolase family 76 protein n=1 Tax=Annulohypoxylon maeteangense TaxID=1927788 RepID=UPI0020072318|nr:glycoside hydrolase family 76 protein [Annulohypoxylon maeteangense]KAI0882116.1 glycoside hydrolase family 76 protein [Annulohypoxylon maeteangense]